MSKHEKHLTGASATLTLEEIAMVRQQSDQLFSFSISRSPAFDFRSGQSVLLGRATGTTANGGRGDQPLLHPCLIASPPDADELEFISAPGPADPLFADAGQLRAGVPLFLGRNATQGLATDDLLPGRRLFMLATGTGLAPFLSIARDPHSYQLFEHLVLVSAAPRIRDLGYRFLLESHFAEEPQVEEMALARFHYLPTITEEDFVTRDDIGQLITSGRLFDCHVDGPRHFDPEQDRILLCGDAAMNADVSPRLHALGFGAGSLASITI